MTDLRPLIDRIRDARRYTRDWELAERVCRPLVADLYVMCIDPIGHPERTIRNRIATNIRAGIDLAVTSPDVLGGYLLGAEIELMSLAERLEKAANHPCPPRPDSATTEPKNPHPSN